MERAEQERQAITEEEERKWKSIYFFIQNYDKLALLSSLQIYVIVLKFVVFIKHRVHIIASLVLFLTMFLLLCFSTWKLLKILD